MKKLTLLVVGLLMCTPTLFSQAVITHQYRRVEPANMQEYMNREVTYWQKLAESEVTKGNLTFWAILQKVGGLNQDKSANILIVNTFNDIDASNEIWGNIQELFPDKKMEDMQTGSLSKNMATVFLRSGDNFIAAPDVDPQKDFKYVFVLYHQPKDVVKHMDFEAKEWKPMVEKAMTDGKTKIKGWGNDYILFPESAKFRYRTSSYDLFSTLSDALGNHFTDDFTWPENFGNSVDGNNIGPRHRELFRIVAMVSAPPAE